MAIRIKSTESKAISATSNPKNLVHEALAQQYFCLCKGESIDLLKQFLKI